MPTPGHNATQYFTFSTTHPLGKFHVKIDGYSKYECRKEMLDMFGAKWAFQYDEPPKTTSELPLLKDEYGYLRLII